jgi:hypothetical protein
MPYTSSPEPLHCAIDPAVVHQGQAVAESVDDVLRGEAGDEPAALLITYAGTPDVPTSVPAKGEKAEY